MAITVTCDSCDKKYQVRDSLVGKSVVCKECGARIQVSPTSPGIKENADDGPAVGYSVTGGAGADSTSSPLRKSRAAPAERVLARNSSEFPSVAGQASSAKRRALAIYGGVAGLLVAVVALIVKSVAPPEPIGGEGQMSAPPVLAPAQTSRPIIASGTREKPVAAKKPSAKSNMENTAPDARINHEPTPMLSLETTDSAVGESEDSSFTIEHGDRVWSVTVDRPAEPIEFDERKRILAAIPRNSTRDVTFPDCPSSVVAVGSNNSVREIREVRDLQANRRLGAVRGAVLVNARPALSPDGELFAAWPAGQGRIGVWNVKSEKPRGFIPVPGIPIPRLLMFAGNERLIAVGGAAEMYIWSMPEGFLQETVPLPETQGPLVAGLSPGGRFLALAVGDSEHRRVRTFDLTTGTIAGEIKFGGFADELPDCHAVAFSPDGAEFAVLYESPAESNLLAFQADSGQLTTHIAVHSSLKTSLNARNWQGGRALEWFPNRQRWLVYGQGLIDRSVGEMVWRLPRDKSGAIQIGHVLDDDRLLILGMEKQEPALVVHEVPRR